MESPITIIIPTHNRPHYLCRAIQYFSNLKYPVAILDSSHKALELGCSASVSYFHLPAMLFPEKLYFGLTHIKTEFIIMCADDDFLVLDGVDECLDFLRENRQYSVVDGSVLFYKKNDIFNNQVNFNLLYKTNLSASFESENTLERIADFFKDYRTVFYGVHYTKNIIDAYEKCRGSFQNLFLNEYLLAFIPVSAGYCKIIPRLISVRESTEQSGDKTTPTLEVMLADVNGVKELDTYIHSVATAILPYTDTTLADCISTVRKVLKKYALQISGDKQAVHNQSRSIIKKIGNIILKIPFIGAGIVRQRRLKESKKEISLVIKTKTDEDNLKLIERYILDFN